MRCLMSVQGLAKEEERQIIQEGTAEEIATIQSRRDELGARIQRAKEQTG